VYSLVVFLKMNGGGVLVKSWEYSYEVFWNGSVFAVDNIDINSQSVHSVLQQIVKRLSCEHDLKEIEKEFHKNNLQFSFMKYNKWYSFTNVEQLSSSKCLRITCNSRKPSAFYIQDFTGHYILCSLPNFEYLFCECVQMGSEIKCTTASGLSFEAKLGSNAKCHHKWCNKQLASNIEFNLCRCLLIKGEQRGEVLAGYCSIKCAMEYRKENLERMKQETLKSFRFLIRASRGDIRLMRILRFVHDQIEFSLREQRNMHETLEYLSFC